MPDSGVFSDQLEDFTLCCPLCGSSLGNRLNPSEVPLCCYGALTHEVVRLRRAILQHRKDTGSDDGCVINEADDDLYETIGMGKSLFFDPEESEDWLYDSDGNKVERRDICE
jgi:hypothetical protein